jgi:hypothetical protein
MVKFRICFTDKSGFVEIEGEILEKNLPVIEGDVVPLENIKSFFKKLNIMPLEFNCPWENYILELQDGRKAIVKIPKGWVLKVMEEKEIVRAGVKGIEQKIHQVPQQNLIGFKRVKEL